MDSQIEWYLKCQLSLFLRVCVYICVFTGKSIRRNLLAGHAAAVAATPAAGGGRRSGIAFSRRR